MRRFMKQILPFLIIISLLLSVVSYSIAETQLSKGDTGEEVKKLQAALVEQGYIITDPEGEYGNSTKNAVFLFQDEHGLDATGIFDEKTYQALYNIGVSDESHNEELNNTQEDEIYTRNNPYPGEIATAKSRLWLLGYDCGNTNGEADSTFVEQITLFQKDNGLSETGICDAATRETIETKVNQPKLYPVLRKNDSGALLFGLIDIEGNLVVPAEYERCSFEDGIFCMTSYPKKDFFYQTGEKLDIPYDTNGSFENGFCVAEDKNGEGLINTAGQPAIPFDWKRLSIYYSWGSNWYRVSNNGKDGFIDPTGTLLVDCIHSHDLYIDALGEGWYDVSGDRFLNAYDKSLIIDYNDNPDRMFVGKFSEGILYVRYSNNQEYMYNTKGEMAFPVTWDRIGAYFYDGRDYVAQDNLYGFIDYSGNVVIDIQYEDVSLFSEGYASARLPGAEKFTIIDRAGNNPLPDIWSEQSIVFHNSIAKIVQDGKAGFIDKQGNTIIPCEWDISEIENADYFAVNKTGFYAYSDMQSYFHFTGDLVLVARNDKLYYINKENEIIASAGPATMIPTTPNEEPVTAPSFNNLKSESECKSIALDYLKNHLKNPDSLQVHSTTSTKSGNEYTFIIDYSAMNSFGGYTRNSYICVVDCTDGKVTSAFSY